MPPKKITQFKSLSKIEAEQSTLHYGANVPSFL
jgi:hypothetical protein